MDALALEKSVAVDKKGVRIRCRYEESEIEVEVHESERSLRALVLIPLVEIYNRSNVNAIDAYALRCIDTDGKLIDGHETGGQVVARYSPAETVELRAVREVPQCLARSRKTERPVASDQILMAQSQKLMKLLDDSRADVLEVRALGHEWFDQCSHRGKEALACVDQRGRTLLHIAASRGDSILCRELGHIDRGVLISALDNDLETPISVAAHQGRSLVLKQLLGLLPNEYNFIVNEKNRHLMTPLQLACCEDGGRSPEVVRLLVEAGADVNAKCWDKTPLMAAAAADDLDLVQTLIIDLGADPFIRNGEGMMAADYCRTQDLADFFFKIMDGHFLSDSAPAHNPSTSYQRTARERLLPPSSMDLPAALKVLDLPLDFLDSLKSPGKQNELLDIARRAWRRLVLKYHPDKHPPDFVLWDEQAQTSWHQNFLRVQAAFELIEASYLLLLPE